MWRQAVNTKTKSSELKAVASGEQEMLGAWVEQETPVALQ